MALLAMVSVVPVFAGLHASRWLGDDAFITLTVARSLAHGEGFAYRGQPVLATTSPLLALVVGLVGRLRPGANLADVAVWLGAAAWLGTGWLVFAARRAFRLEVWPALAVAALVLAAGWTTYLGMEAHLFTLLLTLAAALAMGGRYAAAGIAAGLCTLARGEGALLVPLLAVAACLDGAAGDRAGESSAGPATDRPAPTSASTRSDRRRRVVALVLGWAAVVTPWAVFAARAFDSPLPATLTAKLAQAASGHWRPFVTDLVGRWLPLWSSSWTPVRYWLLGPVPWLALFGFSWSLRRDRRLLVFAAWAALYVLAYAVMGVPGYPWYSLPVLFVLQILLALGAARVARLRTPARPRLAEVASVLVVTWLVTGAAAARVVAVDADAGDPRAPTYLQLADWLDRNVPASASVAFVEVGYLGYFAPQPIVDLAGLVTPDVVHAVRRGDFADGFYRHRPDVFVYLPDFDWALGAIVSDPRFGSLYSPVAHLPGPNEAPFTIYRLVPGQRR